jgi:hypothetical protein
MRLKQATTMHYQICSLPSACFHYLLLIPPFLTWLTCQLSRYFHILIWHYYPLCKRLWWTNTWLSVAVLSFDPNKFKYFSCIRRCTQFMKNTVFWDVKQCSLVQLYWHFRGMYSAVIFRNEEPSKQPSSSKHQAQLSHNFVGYVHNTHYYIIFKWI